MIPPSRITLTEQAAPWGPFRIPRINAIEYRAKSPTCDHSLLMRLGVYQSQLSESHAALL